MTEITIWTPEVVARLRELYDDPSMPYSVIADRLSEEFGVHITRNAVAGEVGRLALPKRLVTYTSAPHRTNRQPKRRKLLRRWSIPMVWQMQTVLPMTAKHCQWPVNAEGEPWRFCGGERLSSGPYCPEHAARAYIPPRHAVRRPQDE